MFEKEAEEWVKTKGTDAITCIKENIGYDDVCEQAFKDGAEFGYNKALEQCAKKFAESNRKWQEILDKANEWHYVKDGDLPEEDKSIMIYAKLADGVAVGKRRKQGKVYEWYFATYDGTFCLRDKEVIAWKEIVLPELKESEA